MQLRLSHPIPFIQTFTFMMNLNFRFAALWMCFCVSVVCAAHRMTLEIRGYHCGLLEKICQTGHFQQTGKALNQPRCCQSKSPPFHPSVCMNACAITGSYNLTWNAQCRSTAGNRQPVINSRHATCFSPEVRRPPGREFALCKHCNLCCSNKNPRRATLGLLTPKPQPHAGKIHKLESCQTRSCGLTILIFHCSKWGRYGRWEWGAGGNLQRFLLFLPRPSDDFFMADTTAA